MVSARSDCVSTHISTERPPPRVLCVEAGERLLSCFIMAGGGAGAATRGQDPARVSSTAGTMVQPQPGLGWAGLGWAGLGWAGLGC